MLIIDNVYMKYNQSVLSGISMQIEKGSIIGIAGKNGSGKSTLLKIITSITKPTSGSVMLDNVDVFKNPSIIKNEIGYVPQENSLFDDLTVKDNIIFWASSCGQKYNSFDLHKDILHKKVKDLSGGMRKRINILVSLINNPNYLLMDEPTANLDIYYKREILNMILKYKKENKAIVITSHDANELLLCDKIYIIKNGVFVYEGLPSNLNENCSIDDTLYDIISDDGLAK